MSQLHIDKVYPKRDGLCPMVVHFQNGYATEEFNTKPCVLLEDENSQKKTILTEINDLLYAGEEQEHDLGRTYILAQNKKTGKVRIIEVENIEMKPILKSDLEQPEMLENSYLELSRKFGSKKHKQMMEQKEKLKINVQTVTEQMQNVTDTVTEDQVDLSSYIKANNEEFYIPPINREASKVEDVYDLYEILTSDQYDTIYEDLQKSDYKSDLNPFLKSLASKDMSAKQTVLLVYANSLLNIYGMLMKDISRKNFQACTHSVTLNNVIMQNFFSNVNGKRGRSPQYKDKSLCHALVFILLANNYKFSFDDLCQQLKLTPRTVMTKVAITGATLVNVGSKKVAHLKLPLTRPALRRKSNKF